MKKYFLAFSIMFLMGTTIYGQFGLGSSNSDNDNFVKLGEVIPALKSFEGNEEIDGLGKSVVYDKIGNDSYDNLFFEAAKLYGTVKQLNFFIAQSKKKPDFFVDGVGLEFKNSVSSMLTTKFLEDLMQQSTGFSGKLKSFNPKDDFTGFKMNKIPGAITGIKNATTNLSESVKGIEELLKTLKSDK